jgi:hypothetical protein
MVRRPSSITWSALIAVVAIIAYVVLPLQGDYAWWGLVLVFALAGLAVPVMARILMRVDRSDRPVVEAVAYLGALGTVALLVPASVYVVAAHVWPESFAGGLETKIDGIYFTVTIASTVGFGDIHPVSQGARVLTTVHILASLILLGTAIRLITRVAGLRVTDRMRRTGQ